MPHYESEPKIDTSVATNRMVQWLETFPYGFKANDPSTWGKVHLPEHMKGGMCHGYRVQHEKVIWDARSELALIDTFSKLWGTKELLKGMQCVQGILNLARNGPDDSGLVHGFKDEEIEWFKKRGCEETKVCAGPGDLILWDSRQIHYNKVPSSGKVRAVMYICYTPAGFASKAGLETKASYFQQRVGTTHWPHANIFLQEDKDVRLGQPDEYSRDRPAYEPEESDVVLRVAGVKAY
ncbi:hypothetical protein BCR34DRAFT_621431 [Clohesyomyces aquaticus]|uniref:Phytanoyl-CoA dioxygenase n=1 Tax=Clohesyomyces aquaticus TaxID=1231657 RepID=A0A1Y2A813_9PLEO|nr:hypothetical protein BCR34DRAFT_621431 [Clohesyomyces aquaticus]